MKVISCIFCKCRLPSAVGAQDTYLEHLQGWHKMTVSEEVDRAVQIANAVQETWKSSSSKIQEVSDTSAPKAVVSLAPSFTCLPSTISSTSDVTLQRSPALSPCSQSCSNNSGVGEEVEEISFENVAIGGGRKSKKEENTNLVKLKRTRNAQSKIRVTCTDCGIKLHWSSLSKHRKRYHPKKVLHEVPSTPGSTEVTCRPCWVDLKLFKVTHQTKDELQSMEWAEAVVVNEWKDLRKFVVISKGSLKTGERRTYKCTICGHSGKSSAVQVQDHIESAHFKGSFKHECAPCEEQFYTRMSLLKHIRSEHQLQKVLMSATNQKSEVKMDSDEVKEWKDLNRFITCKEKGKKGRNGKLSTLECALCGRTDWRRGHLMNHVEQNHFRKKFVYSCSVCGAHPSTKHALECHMRKKHRE